MRHLSIYFLAFGILAATPTILLAQAVSPSPFISYSLPPLTTSKVEASCGENLAQLEWQYAYTYPGPQRLQRLSVRFGKNNIDDLFLIEAEIRKSRPLPKSLSNLSFLKAAATIISSGRIDCFDDRDGAIISAALHDDINNEEIGQLIIIVDSISVKEVYVQRPVDSENYK